MAMLTENDVVNQRFKEPKRVDDGYDQDEVDFFLDEVAETIAQLTREKADLDAQLKAAQARITELENALEQAQAAPAPAAAQEEPQAVAAPAGTDDASTATGMLSLAQRLHDEYVANGKAESERLITEAEAARARIEKETEEHRNQTLTKLDEERSVLERKISDLREFERDYRSRLKGYLEQLLTSVNGEDAQS